MTDDQTPDESTVLSREQRARTEALGYARAALADDSGGALFSGGSQGLPKRFGVPDLIDLASWIETGTDPLAVYRAEREQAERGAF